MRTHPISRSANYVQWDVRTQWYNNYSKHGPVQPRLWAPLLKQHLSEHGRESIVIVGILLLESSFPGKLLVRETELLEIVSIELFITAKVHIASLLNSFQVLLGHVLHTLPVVQVNTGLGLRECSSFASNDPAIGHRPITESFMEGANADYAATLLTHIIL